MCQHCSTQTHSPPEGDRQVVSFTPFQYKQHIKKLKSAIELKSLPNIPTSASGSECPQIILDQIFRADYSQLTQIKLSTPQGYLKLTGHPTPAFHIPQDLSTIFEYLQLEPLIENYICCPQCFFLNGLTEYLTTDQPHCQSYNEPNEHDPPCTQSLGKFINSFEPCTQNTTNMKQKFIPKKTFPLSTIRKLAFQISPVGWNYGNSASTLTIPNSSRFPHM
ncbi:hypothetical protein O181_046719 [Austropuccinia psidii MF-1]|uniref:Uncharacterized protein n=1 Tax=Austropuccinia psidii MF-1 TaxID=1389203 RepID=A0A9Q3DPG1_9BASI|nr:hypothetical protein [Austropuccinia psidii MF-1]